MSEGTVHLALFNEIDPAAEAIDKLRDLGVPDRDMSIISGVPYSDQMLGRPMSWTRLPVYSISGFLGGLVVGLLFNWGAPLQYPIRVGNMPYLPIPTTLVLTFEFCMLGLMLFTFLGVIWESAFPSFGPKVYRNDISDGRIGVVFNCPAEIHTQVHDALGSLGPEWVQRAEAINL